MKRHWVLAAALATICVSSAWADDDTVQPYIDQLKKGLKPDDSEGYSERLKEKLPPEQSSEGYTERLREANPALQLQGTPEKSYSEELKAKLPPKKEGGAIEAFKEGKSKLKKIKSTDIHGAFGIRVGMFMNRNFSAHYNIGTGRNFDDVYGTGFQPDVAVFAEHQFIHNEHVGSVGMFGMLDIARYSGAGTFGVPIYSGYNGQQIPASATGVTYWFWEFPAIAGAVFRLNLTKYFRPYAMLGPTVIGAKEYRSDGGDTNSVVSYGGFAAIGMAFLLDNISKDVDWESYADYGLKHTYFTLEYSDMQCLSISGMNFNTSGLVGGIAFEF